MSILQPLHFLSAQPQLCKLCPPSLLFWRVGKKWSCHDSVMRVRKNANSTTGRWQSFLLSSSLSISHIHSLLPTPASTSSLPASLILNSIIDNTSHPLSLHNVSCCTACTLSTNCTRTRTPPSRCRFICKSGEATFWRLSRSLYLLHVHPPYGRRLSFCTSPKMMVLVMTTQSFYFERPTDFLWF